MVWRFPKRSLDYRVTITDAKGIVIYDSLGRDLGRDNSRWNDVYRTLRGEYGARSSPEIPGEEGDTVMHVAAPVYDPADGRTLIGVLSLAQPNRSIDPFIAASQRAIIERGAWLIGLSALVGVLVTMWLTTGLGQLSRYARAVSAGEPVPPPRRRRDEIGDLGQRVFERFYSLARPGSGRRSSGLGLPFVQEVARLHDGRASVDVREGGGTVASLWLPSGAPGQRPRR